MPERKKAIIPFGTKKGEVFLVDVNTQLKRNNVTTDIKMDVKSYLSTTIVVEEHAPGLKAIFSFKAPDYTMWLILEDKNIFKGDGMIQVTQVEDLSAYQLVHLVTRLDIHQFVYLITFMNDILCVKWLKGTREQELLETRIAQDVTDLNKWNGLKDYVVVHWFHDRVDKATWRSCCNFINLFMSRLVTRPQMLNRWDGCCFWGRLELSIVFGMFGFDYGKSNFLKRDGMMSVWLKISTNIEGVCFDSSSNTRTDGGDHCKVTNYNEPMSRNEVVHKIFMKWFTKSRQVIYHHIERSDGEMD
ncbi:mitochondrial outer membrane protein porin of 34 kDa-like protein [Tanacetum coccineum]